MRPVTAFLGLGANLGANPGADPGADPGDRHLALATALERLNGVPGVELIATSRLRETEPVDAPAGSPRFLNGVAELRVTLPAAALLAICRQLEADAGRDFDAPRNAPRPLDLDILLYGDARIDTRDLRVPHPRMFARRFVMEPLAELMDVSRLQPEAVPRVLRDGDAIVACTAGWRAGACSVGLVPTMGALHAGHASLLRLARAECDRVVATIFVNPLQFAATEDLDDYPRTWDADLALLRAHGADAVFAPLPQAMYGDGFCSTVAVGQEAATMEGAMRPGHFSGVATVVAKLLNLTQPTRAYFGQKDAQQVAVLRRMVQDLSYPIELRLGGIVREPDGLALSSRNVYLQPEDRAAAAVLIRGLRAARALHRGGERDRAVLLESARAVIAGEPRVRLDYLELRAGPGLARLPAGPVEAGRLLVAAWVGPIAADAGSGGRPVRLIDNLALTGDE